MSILIFSGSDAIVLGDFNLGLSFDALDFLTVTCFATFFLFVDFLGFFEAFSISDANSSSNHPFTSFGVNDSIPIGLGDVSSDNDTILCSVIVVVDDPTNPL